MVVVGRDVEEVHNSRDEIGEVQEKMDLAPSLDTDDHGRMGMGTEELTLVGRVRERWEESRLAPAQNIHRLLKNDLLLESCGRQK